MRKGGKEGISWPSRGAVTATLLCALPRAACYALTPTKLRFGLCKMKLGCPVCASKRQRADGVAKFSHGTLSSLVPRKDQRLERPMRFQAR
jgi:hypothetical protein